MEIFDSFDGVSADAMRAFESAAQRSFFASLPWFRNLERTVFAVDGAKPLIALQSDAAPEDAIALPLLSPALASRALQSAGNYYTPEFDLLAACGAEPGRERLTRFFRELAKRLDRTWTTLDLRPLPSQSATAYVEILNAIGLPATPYFCFGNWYLDVADRRFEQYFASLPSRTRNTVNRKEKKFSAGAGNRIDVVTGSGGLDEALAAYRKVYDASWKVPEPYPEFIPGLARTSAAEGCLRLGVAYVGGEPAAAQFWIVWRGVASILKLAYDEKFAEMSVGSILTTRLMRHAIDEDGVAVVDYLSGDDGYKKDWMSARRERWGVRVYNPRTLHGRLAHYGESVRRVLKRFRRSPAARAAQ